MNLPASANRESVLDERGTPEYLGQPFGLFVLAGTEMWEVFSFLGMKTLLIYFMTSTLLFKPAAASLILGIYAGGAYLVPVVGGLLVDNWLGNRRAVIIGGLTMAAGNFLLMFDKLFFPALFITAVGAGLYRPALPSQIKTLYASADKRKDSAFSIYYMAMNTGALLAPFVCGTIGEFWGWNYGFGCSAIGMLLGVSFYAFGQRYLPESNTAERHKGTGDSNNKTQLSRIAMIVAIALAVTIFRGAYEQLGNVLALWIRGGVDRTVAGWTIPMTWFQAVNPFFVIVLSPVLIRIWSRRSDESTAYRAAGKMSTGALILGLAYCLLAVIMMRQTPGTTTSWLWVCIFIGGLTLAELYLLPICLGLFTQLAPGGFAATSVALWFATGFGGNLIAGFTGLFWERIQHSVYFLLMALLAGLAGITLYLLKQRVRRVAVESHDA